MRPLHVGFRPKRHLQVLLTGMVVSLAPAASFAQSTTATVAVSLRVLSPVSSAAAPDLSLSVAHEAVASAKPILMSARPTARTVTAVGAVDERGALPTRIGATVRPRNRQPAEVAVLAPALVELGLLSRDSVNAASAANAYFIRLRDTPMPDTGVVKIRLRSVITVVGT
ncbi:MAG: hypothetical protein HOQ19_08105 [Gemmatimonadaceae bacterium]|nr:hypothetical protein [Gemmatimonadaceae bacterium]